MAEWLHLFPSRTEQLSTHTPTIVLAKIGRCLIFFCPFFPLSLSSFLSFVLKEEVTGNKKTIKGSKIFVMLYNLYFLIHYIICHILIVFEV